MNDTFGSQADAGTGCRTGDANGKGQLGRPVRRRGITRHGPGSALEPPCEKLALVTREKDEKGGLDRELVYHEPPVSKDGSGR